MCHIFFFKFVLLVGGGSVIGSQTRLVTILFLLFLFASLASLCFLSILGCLISIKASHTGQASNWSFFVTPTLSELICISEAGIE